VVRILHVSDCYPPRTGGIETQVRDLARAQHAAGHEVHVLTATPGPAGERGGVRQDDEGVVVHRLGAHLPFDLPVNPAAVPRMRALLSELAPDVVHVHAGVVSPFAFDGARLALAVGLPLAITWHCMLDGTVPAMRAGVRLGPWRHAPAALSAVSRAAADRVAGVFGGDVAVLPNGMDLERWAPSGAPASDGVLHAVATMRLAPRKRGPALVGVIEDAVTQLAPGALRVDILGDGPSRTRMERSVRRRALEDVVTLRGRLDRDAVREAYRDAHVFLAPAELEAFGIAALEARTAGLVVVARRGTGIEEFVTDGVDGLLVADDAGMARALVHLVHAPALRAGLQSRARAVRPRFSWDHAVAAAAAEYSRAVALRG
jgi:glycosyltransferase involved in cell wall biosynthesis